MIQFYDQYVERVIEKNRVVEYVINVLSETDFVHEDTRICVSGRKNGMKIVIRNNEVKNFVQK